jgi:DNA-binding NarL/FixJ family response regulator
MLSKGESWKGIAGQLEISTETVRLHVFNLRRKLAVKNSAQAIAKIFLV